MQGRVLGGPAAKCRADRLLSLVAAVSVMCCVPQHDRVVREHLQESVFGDSGEFKQHYARLWSKRADSYHNQVQRRPSNGGARLYDGLAICAAPAALRQAQRLQRLQRTRVSLCTVVLCFPDT